MKIAVTGTRGIPSIQGGVETHCEELFPRIAASGAEITLFRRVSYVGGSEGMGSFRGVRLVDLPTPRKKAFEAIIHTARAVARARRMNADIIHIHAIGPALLTPVARMLGMKVVVTHHGFDYDREKWGRAAKFMLRLGERLGARHADALIVISDHIRTTIASRYGRTDTDLIFNGVPEANRDPETDCLDSWGVKSGEYVLALGRFVKEKNFHLLIEAFRELAPGSVKLVIAGDADMPDEYSENLKRKARAAGVVLTGFVKGKPLRQLLTHARLFCLPSTHEGLPISLLEAMSYDLDVLVSDIPANRLPQLAKEDFFATGDRSDLVASLRRKLDLPPSRRRYDLSDYDWDVIARKTAGVYRRILGQSIKS